MKCSFITLFLLTTLLATGQGRIAFACSYYGDNTIWSQDSICLGMEGVAGGSDHREASQIINRIMTRIGLPKNFVLVQCDKIENCMAVNLEAKTGQLRYIVYDKAFMKQLDGKAGTYWSAISIFAHEIGHHLSGHTIDGLGSRPDKELEADKFSGFVLHKMGATLAQAQAAMQALPDVNVISTHPPRANRLAAITEGWNDAWRAVQEEKELRQTVELKPLSQIGGDLFNKGALALETGKYADAVKWFNASLNLNSKNPQAFLGRARAYGELKMYRLAYANLDSVLYLTPFDPLFHVYRGRYKTMQGLYVDASNEFKKALTLDSNCAAAYAEKSILQNALGLHGIAFETASAAIDKNYKNIHIPLAQQGYALYKLKDYEKALFFLKLALQVNPVYEYAKTWWEKARKAYLESLSIEGVKKE